MIDEKDYPAMKAVNLGFPDVDLKKINEPQKLIQHLKEVTSEELLEESQLEIVQKKVEQIIDGVSRDVTPCKERQLDKPRVPVPVKDCTKVPDQSDVVLLF